MGLLKKIKAFFRRIFRRKKETEWMGQTQKQTYELKEYVAVFEERPSSFRTSPENWDRYVLENLTRSLAKDIARNMEITCRDNPICGTKYYEARIMIGEKR